MRLPVNLFLYLTSTGLLGFAGWTFYQALQQGGAKVHSQNSETGVTEAKDLLAKGRGLGPVSASWNYGTPWWKDSFMAPNLIGKAPVKPVEGQPEKALEPKPTDLRPLTEIIELVSLVHDGSTGGKGGTTHVIVRFRDGGAVQPPLWWERENTPVVATPGGAAPGDAVVGNAGTRGGRSGPGRPTNPTRPATPMPVSSAGREVLQRVWAAGDGSPRFEATLWPPFDDIRLVRVEGDAKSAWFVRAVPPPKPGEPAVDPKEEELYKSTTQLPQDVLKELAALQRQPVRAAPTANDPVVVPAGSLTWRETEDTQRFDGVWHLGKKDERVFQENPDSFMEKVNVDSYRTAKGTKGLRVLNVAPEVATRFGVQQGDVILSINGVEVATKSDAINVGRKMYERGTRTFAIEFLSNGQRVTRTYQAPDRRN